MNPPAPQQLFTIEEASQIAAVRRGASEMARHMGFEETQNGRLAIIVTEAATNILKHASRGALILRCVGNDDDAMRAIELLAFDAGPGMASLHASLEDGVSTAGSAGTGLGAMQRLADDFDAYSLPAGHTETGAEGHGSIFYMTVHALGNDRAQHAAQPSGIVHGAICLPLASENVSGDAWCLREDGPIVTVMLADGLGHGPAAHTASQAAIAMLAQHGTATPARLLELAHNALRPTRGAAVAVARIDLRSDTVTFAGVGNIAASINGMEGRRQMMSHNGIVGSNIRKIQELSFAWPRDATLIMHSDGLGSHWDLQRYARLEFRHPALIAAALYRDHVRLRDDATVVVVKKAALA